VPTTTALAGTYCLTGSKDRSIKLWNPHRGTQIKSFQGHGYDVRGLAVTDDNARFVSCGGDKAVYLWDVATGSIVRRFKGHDAAANDVRFASGEQARRVQDRGGRVWGGGHASACSTQLRPQSDPQRARRWW